jgi:hypothetical protein
MTVGAVLEDRLRQLGVERIYGLPLGGLRHVDVDDPDLAVLLADSDGRIAHHDGSGRLGAALLEGPILHLSSQPGGTAALLTVRSLDEALDALVDPPGMTIPGTSALHLDLDLSAPVEGAVTFPRAERQPVMTLDPAMAELRMVLVVGPGVVRARAVDALAPGCSTLGGPRESSDGTVPSTSARRGSSSAISSSPGSTRPTS